MSTIMRVAGNVGSGEGRSRLVGLVVALALAGALLFAACAAPEDQPALDPSPAPSEPVDPADPAAPAPTPADVDEPVDEPVDAPPVSFERQTIRIVVGFTPGGGYDMLGRTYARFMPQYMPGNPRFVVENRPGGGGLRGKQEVFRSSPDGLTAGLVHGRYTIPRMLGEEVPGYDAFQVRLVGGATHSPARQFFMMRRDIAATWDEMMALGRDIRVGETEPGCTCAAAPIFLEYLDYPFRMLFGFGGVAEITPAMDRGELDGLTRTAPETLRGLWPEWFETQFVVPVFRFGTDLPLADHTEPWGVSPEDLPHLFELVDFTPEQEEGFTMFVESDFGRALFLPPGAPDDVYDTWVDAMVATWHDEGFREMATAQGLDLGLITGPELVGFMERGAVMSEEAQKWFSVASTGRPPGQ